MTVPLRSWNVFVGFELKSMSSIRYVRLLYLQPVLVVLRGYSNSCCCFSCCCKCTYEYTQKKPSARHLPTIDFRPQTYRCAVVVLVVVVVVVVVALVVVIIVVVVVVVAVVVHAMNCQPAFILQTTDTLVCRCVSSSCSNSVVVVTAVVVAAVVIVALL